MSLEFLKSLVRVQTGIEVIETNDETDGNTAIRHVVDESAAELFGTQRPAHRVNDAPSGFLFLRDVPDFLHPDGVDLRIAVLVELELPNELFGKRAAGAFGKNRDLCPNVDARFEVAFVIALFVDSFVAGERRRRYRLRSEVPHRQIPRKDRRRSAPPVAQTSA